MKNPWMSMWLSAANSWTGMARSFWSAEMQRQQTALMRQMTEQMLTMWMAPFAPPRTKSNARSQAARSNPTTRR